MTDKPTEPQEFSTLNTKVKMTIERYFNHLDGAVPCEIYNMVLKEIEPPLLQATMNYTQGNQSQAAKMLGISRGTLRKKLECYEIID